MGEGKMKIQTLPEFLREYKGNKGTRDRHMPLGEGTLKLDGKDVPYEDRLYIIELKDCEAPSAIVMARRYVLGSDGECYSDGIATLTDKEFGALAKEDDPLYSTFDQERVSFFFETFLELSETWKDGVRKALKERSERITEMHEHIEKNAMYGEF